MPFVSCRGRALKPSTSFEIGVCPHLPKKKPSEYLKQLYFDSLVFSSEAVRHLVAQVGASQIVMGSDYPYQWQLHPVDHIFGCSFLSDNEKAGMLSNTAAKLLNLQT